MNDLRYNMYGGARYPSPAVVGGFGGAVAGSIDRSAALIEGTSARARSGGSSGSGGSGGSRPRAKPAPAKPSIEIYRGTTSNQYKVGL
jgi:pilus assembly protein CpaB